MILKVTGRKKMYHSGSSCFTDVLPIDIMFFWDRVCALGYLFYNNFWYFQSIIQSTFSLSIKLETGH